jgi:hypothetical protein
MKRLLYCVCLGGGRRPLPALRGVDAGPVTLVCHRGLCAATSPVEDPPLVPTVERILAYEGVVEAIFASRTVVPMRFGSILESDAAVARHLEERASELRAELRELSDCAEMGIRVLAIPPRAAAGPGAARRSTARPRPARRSGRAYLQARARVFERDGPPAPDVSGLVERYRRAFQGLFTRLEVEAPTPVRLVVGTGGKPRLEPRAGGAPPGPAPPAQAAPALSFPVPRARVADFRAAFDRLGQGPATSRLSGPWPPYSFVAP